jgi:hypothetical protein
MSYSYHRRLREMQPWYVRLADALRGMFRRIKADAIDYFVEDFLSWNDRRYRRRP